MKNKNREVFLNAEFSVHKEWFKKQRFYCVFWDNKTTLGNNTKY